MIKLRTYNLDALDKNKHYKIISKLQHDPQSCKYVSKNLAKWLSEKEPITKDKFEIGASYVLVKDNIYLGIIGTLNLDRNNVIELWCSISPEHRHEGHASKFLGEITLYLIENIKGLEDIKLKIDATNIYSNKTAISNGYNLLHKEEDKNIYQYFKTEEKSTTQNKKR